MSAVAYSASALRRRGRKGGSAGAVAGHLTACFLVAVLSAGLIWIVPLYASGLRDPRYLDGWLLAAGMVIQLGFHVAIVTARLSPKALSRWKRLHIYLGYLLVAVFASHSDYSLPDSVFEWLLWTAFVLVTASGVWGTYLGWSQRARLDKSIAADRIASLRADLAREVAAAVDGPPAAQGLLALPGLPHEAWIAELYATRLKDFFAGPRNLPAHLLSSRRPRERLVAEIDGLSAYVDRQSKERLATIKSLVIEKDRLDHLRVHLALNRIWLLMHVPATYALLVLSVVHVVVTYAFSSGAW